jgi:hypothetical protein
MTVINYVTLKSAATVLKGRDAEFAASLTEQWGRFGSLSEKQMHWAGVLIERAFSPQPAAKAPTTRQPEVSADFSRLRHMFSLASAAGLKRPKIKVVVNDVDLKFAPAPISGNNPGYIYVHSQGEYAGKVSPEGNFFGNPKVRDALLAFALDPAGKASAHGHATGECCFCSRELTDPASVAVGYGPICAGNYGLPHGQVRSPEIVVDVSQGAAA